MKNEDEKLREAARMLSVNCEGRRDGCKGCLFCRDNLSCKINGIPVSWDSDFGLDEHIVDANKKVSTPTDTPTETDTPTDTPTTRAEILDAAKKIVTGEREKQYGSPEDNFGVIARLWSTYAGREFTPVDVAVMMTLLKVARIRTGHYKVDSYIDACGYLACAAEIAEELI
nr:MAG TPA: hypothetical protein [Caudoviricetes sp.]